MADNRRDQILDRIMQTIAEVTDQAPDDLNSQTELVADLNIDSLAMFEIVIDLEEAFALQISDEDIDRIRTIGDIVDYVDRATNPAGK
jgi:acyl carrier protein